VRTRPHGSSSHTLSEHVESPGSHLSGVGSPSGLVVVLHPGEMALVTLAPAAQPAGLHQLERYIRLIDRFLPPIRILHPFTLSPLRRQNPREEPGALAAYAGICAGATGNGRPYRDHKCSSRTVERAPLYLHVQSVSLAGRIDPSIPMVHFIAKPSSSTSRRSRRRNSTLWVKTLGGWSCRAELDPKMRRFGHSACVPATSRLHVCIIQNL
jgi:hypothetical protein